MLNDELLIFEEFNDVGALLMAKLFAMLPPPELLLPVRKIGGTGISWERSVLFELCILTASDSDVKSGGKCVNKVSRVIFNEHNLDTSEEKMQRNQKRHFYIKLVNYSGNRETVIQSVSDYPAVKLLASS